MCQDVGEADDILPAQVTFWRRCAFGVAFAGLFRMLPATNPTDTMRIIAILNQKGGVGKTTTAVNTAAALRRLGRRALLVDLDPQAHLTYSLGVMAHELERSVMDVLRGRAGLGSLVVERDGLHLVPASLALSGADMELAATPGRETLLRSALEGLGTGPGGYDTVLVDCPPNLGLLAVNALAAATELLAPVQPEFLALQSLGMLVRTMDTVAARVNPELVLGGILVTRYQKQKRLNRETRARIREHFGHALLETVIRENIALAEAPSHGMDIFRYAPHSNGALDYLNLGRELMERGKP